MKRRTFLKVAGSAGIILAAGSAGFALTRTPTAALKPWKDAPTLYPDPMRKALSYAILAPNPHNRQPWMVELKGDTEAVLTCDQDRLLPETDPYSRQIVIGLGCFLELFSLAAADLGFAAEIATFPEGFSDATIDHRPIAHLKLRKDPSVRNSPLFAQVLNRHTNREPYDITRAIPDAPLKALAKAAGQAVRTDSTNKGDLVKRLRALTRDAILAEIRDAKAFQESVDLMRIGRSEIEANPDGIFLGGAFLETLNLVGVLTRETVADPKSQSYQIGLDMNRESAEATMGYAWIATRGNSRDDQIAAGRAYMRLTLQATAEGLALQPMSQALQEYNAMAPFYSQAHKMLTVDSGERLQMLVRLGYAESQGPAPRWPLKTRMKAG